MLKKYLPALAFSISMLFLLMLFLAAIPAFYTLLQNLSNVPENTGFSWELIKKANLAIRDYLYGLTPHLIVEFEGKSLFGAQEVFHMAEVRLLFSNIFWWCLGLLGLFVLIPWIIWKPRVFHHQLKTSIGLLAFLAVASFFFQKAFVVMHKIFFNNDLWIFPAKSPLISLLPEKFFFLFTVFLLGSYLALSLLLYMVERKIHDSSSWKR